MNADEAQQRVREALYEHFPERFDTQNDPVAVRVLESPEDDSVLEVWIMANEILYPQVRSLVNKTLRSCKIQFKN